MPEFHGRLVVLGATGFVGSHVVERATSAGREVVALSSRDVDLADPAGGLALAAARHDRHEIAVEAVDLAVEGRAITVVPGAKRRHEVGPLAAVCDILRIANQPTKTEALP